MTRIVVTVLVFGLLGMAPVHAADLRVSGGVAAPVPSPPSAGASRHDVGVSRHDVGRLGIGVGQQQPCRADGPWRCAAPLQPKPHHHHNVIVVPQPVYVVPSGGCVIPGYWTYQWVPQTSWYDVWVPGHYSPDFTWSEGHYEPRPHTTGYYQPLWIPDRWGC